MPIRVNFLAEQQAAEEQRRRDPVKRVFWAAALIVGVIVAWGLFLQARLLGIRAQVASADARFQQLGAKFQLVSTNRFLADQADRRLRALSTVAEQRFLVANALDALQHCIVSTNVKVVELRTKTEYTLVEGTKPTTNNAVVKPGTPPKMRERTLLSVQARDASPNPGDAIFAFQEAVSGNSYFSNRLQKAAELTGRTAVQTDPAATNRPFVGFTIDCQFPERTREP